MRFPFKLLTAAFRKTQTKTALQAFNNKKTRQTNISGRTKTMLLGRCQFHIQSCSFCKFWKIGKKFIGFQNSTGHKEDLLLPWVVKWACLLWSQMARVLVGLLPLNCFCPNTGCTGVLLRALSASIESVPFAGFTQKGKRSSFPPPLSLSLGNPTTKLCVGGQRGPKEDQKGLSAQI